MKTAPSRGIWSRDELIVVLDLYFRIPRAKFGAGTPEVIEVARLIDRTPAAVAKRLANYSFFDNGTGLGHGGTHARKLWQDLGGNPAQVAVEAAQARSRLATAR
jgi:putative restriction endonuclease